MRPSLRSPVVPLALAFLAGACGAQLTAADGLTEAAKVVAATHGSVRRVGLMHGTATVLELTLDDRRYRDTRANFEDEKKAIARTAVAAVGGRIPLDSVRVTLVTADLNLIVYRSHSSTITAFAVAELTR